MALETLMKDLVTLVKKDGTVFRERIRASVQGNKIFIMDQTIPIEREDHILRQLPSGLSEDHIVVQPDFRSGGSLSHWEVKTRRSDQPAASAQTIIDNIHGHNARVNINSTDNSTNTVTVNSDEIFSELSRALSNGIDRADEREKLLALVQGMQEGARSGGFKEKYLSFIAAAANHASIIGPFLPGLAQLL